MLVVVQLLMTEISMTELSRPSDFSWLPMVDAPVRERVRGEVLWPNGVGDPYGR